MVETFSSVSNKSFTRCHGTKQLFIRAVSSAVLFNRMIKCDDDIVDYAADFDANQHSSCSSVRNLLKMLGFEVSRSSDPSSDANEAHDNVGNVLQPILLKHRCINWNVACYDPHQQGKYCMVI